LTATSRIEQAIFTSAQTTHCAGYQVVATSPGVVDADRRELAVWGPSHDSLLELGPDAASINFHPLPSGAFCISRTTPAGWEYSGRGGHRVYTHSLIVPPAVLARFANHPLALARAALAGGGMEPRSSFPAALEPLELPGRASAVDQTSLARLVAQVGSHGMATLVQAALDSLCLAVGGRLPPEQLIAGLLDCLPPECRTEFSFSTGLKFSSRRLFRIVPLPADPAERRWLAHQPNVMVLDLAGGPPVAGTIIDGWSRLIERVLSARQTSFLAAQLSKRRDDFTIGDLSALGLQLLEDFDASAFRGADRLPSGSHGKTSGEECRPRSEKGGGPLRAHAAHSRFEKSTAVKAESVTPTAPSECLAPDSPEALEKLELLDDTVFAAIDGQAGSLERLQLLWPAVLADLGGALVADSREQYLRYALSIWEQCVDHDGVRRGDRAVDALEVLCVLFDGA
jgi:hypothetical protein